MTIYDYQTNWPSWPGHVWPRNKKIVEGAKPSHGNGFVYVKTGPQVEPVTLEEAKLFAKVDGTAEDTLIEILVVAAREAVEGYLKKAVIEQTLVLSMDWWPEPLELPRPPLISVTEVRTLSEEDVETTYASTNYMVRFAGRDVTPGQIVIKTGITPPINTDRYHGGFEVEYKAGYSSDPDEVSSGVKHGVLMLVAYLYVHRLPSITGAVISEVPGLKDVLGRHRRIRI